MKMKIKEFESLTKSEIKKANKAGNGKVGEYTASPSIIEGWENVVCRMFDDDFEEVVGYVGMSICLFDRRRSFVTTVNGCSVL